MDKRIKIEDLNLNVSTGTMFYVDIDIFRFIYDEEIFCLTVEILNGENHEFYEEVNLPEGEVIVDHNDLKRFALNWIFKNVEIVKEAPEAPVQEQLKKDKNNELLALIITANSLISKTIKIIKNDISE